MMSKIMEEGDVQAIRNTMLIHEDVFKHQVRELHRLYCIQKKLTGELRAKINHFHHRSLRDTAKLKEHSRSCSGGNMMVSIGFELERQGEEHISTGKCSIDENRADQRAGNVRNHKNPIETHDSYDEDSEVELTLSIGGNLGKKRSKSSSPHKHKNLLNGISFSSSFTFEREKDLNEPTTSGSSSSANCDPDAKRSHWLFKGLKL